MPLKFITGHQQALTNLYQNVGKNAVTCYDIGNFPASTLSGFYPPKYLAKCTSVTVAVSGDHAIGRDWMAICPYRVDESGRSGAKVYDLDPFVITFDSDAGTPSETGIVAYHQGFGGRTASISGYETLTKEAAVIALREQVVTGSNALPAAPCEVLNALQHMVKIFEQNLR